MTRKKRGLFSRISGKSAKPDSPKINAASSSSQPTGTSSGLPSSSNNAAPSSGLPTSPRAEDEISEIGSSGPSSTSYSPSLAHPAPDEVSEIGSPPIPQKLQDHAKRIKGAAEGVNEENVDANLDELIKYISSLSASIKEKEKEKKKKQKKEMPQLATDILPEAKSYTILKDALSEAINATKEFTASSDAKAIARSFLKDIMGSLHVVNIAFIAIANVWERCEEMSKNQKACLSLLEEMNKLAQLVRKLQKGHKTKEGMEALIRKATALIVEASIVCCTQIEASKAGRYLWKTKYGEERAKLEKQLQQMHTHLQELMGLLTLEAVDQLKRYNPEYPKDAVGTKKPVQLPVHPQHAVGIEDPLNEVIEQLEMGSDKNAVAVILHGFGGMGKTTLADAVFVRLLNAEIEGCRYSYVRLFDDINSVPDVVMLQRFIIKALKMGEEPKDFQRHEEGQLQIESILEKEMVFIYIDNVLRPHEVEQGRDALENLLPKGMGKYARKLRLLLTARDKEAVKISGVETKFYRIEGLHEAEALQLLNNTLDDDRKKQLNDIHLKKMVQICGGVPKLLDVVAGFINNHGENARQAYNTVLEESQENWKGEVGDDIERYVFAYDKLEDKLKDSFLDICSFFRGWDWKELSDIVGKTELEKLEKRALVTLDVKTMTARVHDVILEVGLKKTKGERLRLTSATEIADFLDTEAEGLQNEENLLKQFQSEFESMLTDGEGKPLNISGRPLNTLLLVMFDGHQDFDLDFPLALLDENIGDIKKPFEMVYFGNHWDQLPNKVAKRIIGHAPANGDAKAFFQKLLSLVGHHPMSFDQELWGMDIDKLVTGRFQMSAEIVRGENGDKYLSCWKFFGDAGKVEVEDFVVTKCGRYLKLKQLAEIARESNMELLRELFASGEEESSLGFVKKGALTKVGFDELQGKTILLDIRPANCCYAIPLHALVEMYNVEKERFNFEIITVPIMQEDTKSDVSKKFSGEVPWLVLQNPWQLTNATKYFLVEGCPRWPAGWDWWYPNRMRIIKSDGTMAAYDYPGVLRMVNAWGAAAYPFTTDRISEILQHEESQMEALSHAMFLFQHLKRVSEQLRKATGQQKMICLCRCDEKEFTNSMKDVLTELSDIIYTIYIPNFTPAEKSFKWGYLTVTIDQCYYSTLEPSKMSSAEMRRMFSLSLSEHEAMRFWARVYSLKLVINPTDQTQLSKMISKMTRDDYYRGNWKFLTNDRPPYSGMFIMNEDGNLITTKGKEIIKLLSEKYSDDGRVKELMQQLLKGTQTSWQKTFLELEEMLYINGEDSEAGAGEDSEGDVEESDDAESEGDLEGSDGEYSEGDVEESDDAESEGDLEGSDDAESKGNLLEELCSVDVDRGGDDVIQENASLN